MTERTALIYDVVIVGAGPGGCAPRSTPTAACSRGPIERAHGGELLNRSDRRLHRLREHQGLGAAQKMTEHTQEVRRES